MRGNTKWCQEFQAWELEGVGVDLEHPRSQSNGLLGLDWNVPLYKTAYVENKIWTVIRAVSIGSWHEEVNFTKLCISGTSLAVQWLRLCALSAVGTGSIPGWGTKIPNAAQHGQNKNKNYASLLAWSQTDSNKSEKLCSLQHLSLLLNFWSGWEEWIFFFLFTFKISCCKIILSSCCCTWDPCIKL